MSEAERQKERSRLLNKQKEERTAAEKSLKKLKGNMKEKAQKDLEEMEARHAAELTEFDGAEAGDGGGKSKKKGKDKEEEIIYFPNRQWDGYSKKELEEACAERGLGKKGSKDELIVKLITFHQDLDKKLADNPEAAAKAKAKAEKAAAKADSDDEDEDEDEEDDEDDSTDEEEDAEDAKEALEVSPEEAEKQFKREQLVRKAVRHVLLKAGPIAVDELPKALEDVVKNFTPQICGYTSLRKFAKNQPKKFMIFKKKENMLYPPKE